MNPNEQQRAIIESTESKIFVVAGPGSGKTATLVERIKRDAEKIETMGMVIITFTNAGANELKKRLGDIEPGYIGTLHGYCFRMLVKYGDALGYRKGISIFPEDSKEALLVQVADFLSIKASKKKLMENPPDAVKAEYLFRLKSENMVDFDGILTEALRLLKEWVQYPFPALYVDEAQDSGPVDWAIYEALQARQKIFIGDFDQSIYGFRGAVPHEFMDRADKNGFWKLETNYRSDIEICKAGNQIIELCKKRIQKKIVPHSEKWGVLSMFDFQDDMEEIRKVASLLLTDPMESAILLRTNSLVSRFRETLGLLGVPVKSDPYSKLPCGFAAARALIACWMNRHSNISARKFLDQMAFPNDLMNKRSLECQIAGKPLSSIPEFPQHFWADPYIGPARDFPTMLAQAKIPAESIAVIGTRIKEMGITGLTDLSVDLASHDDWAESKGGSDGVEVLTIHKAKGREWDRVFLPAWESDVIPMSSGEIEEEIRLAFVAITRARHELFITTAFNRKTQWGKKNATPSPFYNELLKDMKDPA
jgi:DNA helicase-2/ATP-dependent DNA helicase PcrA